MVCACAFRLARFSVGAMSDLNKNASKPFHYSREKFDLGDKDLKSRHNFYSEYLTKSKFFAGVPAPMASCLILLPLIYSLSREEVVFASYSIYHVNIYILFVSLLMVCSIPTLSSKLVSRDPTKEPGQTSYLKYFIPLLFLAYFLYLYPWKICYIFILFYLFTIPIGWMLYHKCSKDG